MFVSGLVPESERFERPEERPEGGDLVVPSSPVGSDLDVVPECFFRKRLGVVGERVRDGSHDAWLRAARDERIDVRRQRLERARGAR